ncbi:MAG TPA: serine/threonine-protein kinase [Kofleriaceae bacterium]
MQNRKLCVVCSKLFGPDRATCPDDGSRLVDAEDRERKLGDVLGNYRLLRKLGEGGAGTVYEAEHVRLGRKVALKVLHADSTRPDVVARFFNEARAVNAIRHPNIIDIEDFVTTEAGDHFLVMELLVGHDLRSAISADKTLAFDRVSVIGQQIASALGAVHRVGIVHRDLKPDNIFLVERDGMEVAKLLDFGVAKFLDQQGITRAGMTVGTPAYMAPEQITKGGEVGRGSDIYALGMVLYEAVAGAPAFEGAAVATVLRGHCLEIPRPPSERRGAPTPPVLEAAILRCLEKDPAHRFATADELAAALRSDRPVALAPRRTRRRRAVMLLPALAMAGAAVAVQLWPRSEPLAAAPTIEAVAPPLPVSVPVPPPPKPPATTITITLSSTPAGAELFVDGEPLGRAPANVTIPIGSAPVALKARFADGAEVIERIVPDRPRAELALVRPEPVVIKKSKAPRPIRVREEPPTKPPNDRDATLDPFKTR